MVLLGAWTRVLSSVPSARLLIAGSGGAYRSVENDLRARVVELSVDSSVSFLGWVEDLEDVYASADVFVLPSRSEGMSNALLEACASGRVVVASRIASNIEVLGRSYPLLFEVSSEHDLAEALVEAFTKDATREEARRSALSAVEDNAPTAIARRVVALIDDAADPARN